MLDRPGHLWVGAGVDGRCLHQEVGDVEGHAHDVGQENETLPDRAPRGPCPPCLCGDDGGYARPGAWKAQVVWGFL